jgi:hypothetical protein
MKVNLPFGNSVDIKECTQPEYAYVGKYRFKIVDKWGWDISKPQYRDMRIGHVLDEQSDEVLYHMYLSGESLSTAIVYVDLSKSQLRITGDGIEVKFKCHSLDEAVDLIDLILEPNGYRVAPANLVVG